jgi:sortase A
MPPPLGDALTAAAPPVRRSARLGDVVRLMLRGLGELLITLGFVVLLFALYEVYVSNYFAHEQQVRVRTALAKEWTHGRDPLRSLPGGAVASLPVGAGIANLYIPRLGRDYAWTIVQGTGDADLEKGPGHYRFSALPGQVGNFAIAGHRVGKGEPFLNLDHLRPRDAVVVETESRWYVYRVLPSSGTPDGVPWREIVDPGDGAVVAPVPDHPTLHATARFMTMTTCHPKFTAAQRMVVHAVLVRSVPRTSPGKPAAVIRLYNEVSS